MKKQIKLIVEHTHNIDIDGECCGECMQLCYDWTGPYCGLFKTQLLRETVVAENRRALRCEACIGAQEETCKTYSKT